MTSNDESSSNTTNTISYVSIFSGQTLILPQESIGYGKCRKVNDYVKMNRIGEGTYGVVYRARDNVSSEIVALKRVRINEKTTEVCGISESALREITLLKKVRHQNLVLLKDVAVTRDHKGIFLVMEFCDRDLAAILDHMDTPFALPDIKCMTKQLLEGLEHLHRHFIIHRDLKVSNLLLTTDGILKIADFGLARMFGDEEVVMTTRVVTLWYRPPELLFGCKKQSSGIDMWAVGCILGELLLHRPLMPGKTEIDQIDKIIQLLGTPTKLIWPEIEQMPLLKNMDLKIQQYNNLKRVFESASPAALSLLNELFAYDPARRMTASAALRHPFFTELPLPCDPSLMLFHPGRQLVKLNR
ncbi:unnamed protein product [Caenorhabditis auriculariae]|uniref:cyclin-dependent kinase n=1 Tax=Caenorhabditis auriculariae TaxID=2777116 RepID=A0A8S1GQI5_9PELO|nr:unnamed protein product [Caenorhabditis auriculariae]